MRKILLLFLLISLMSSTMVFAHPGGTDGAGGHINHSTGEYHYHHGYSAHQHPDGVCPYDFDEKTNHSSGDTQNIESGSEPDYIVDINGNVTKVHRNKTQENKSSISYTAKDNTSQASNNIKESPIKDFFGNILEEIIIVIVFYLALFTLVYIPEFVRKILDFIKKKK